jgi:hypothetical protein
MGSVAQVVEHLNSPEFKPQYCQNKSLQFKNILRNLGLTFILDNECVFWGYGIVQLQLDRKTGMSILFSVNVSTYNDSTLKDIGK